MSKNAKNIVAITVGAVAVVVIIALIVLSSIRISPLTLNNGNGQGWMQNYKNVTIYADGQMLPSTNDEGKITGMGEKSGTYSYDDIFDMMSFSLFTACLQMQYGFDLSLKDASNVDNNKVSVKELKDIIANATGADAVGYTFVVTLPEVRTLKLKDDKGRSAADISDSNEYTYPQYDTVLFTVTKSSNWVELIDAYAYLADDVTLESDETGLASKTYYRLTFGARTEGLINALNETFDIDALAENTEEEETEETA